MSSSTVINGRTCSMLALKAAGVAAPSGNAAAPSPSSSSSSSSSSSTSINPSETTGAAVSPPADSTTPQSSSSPPLQPSSTSISSPISSSFVPDAEQNNGIFPTTSPQPDSPAPTLSTTDSIPASADTKVDATTPTTPSEILSPTNDASASSIDTLLTDSSATPSPSPLVSQQQSSDVPATQSPTNPPGEPAPSTTPGVGAAIPTIVSTQPSGSSLESDTNANGGTQQAVMGNAITTQQTIAIAAGVVGGLVALSVIAFLVWLWRKRKLQERRSTMLTPLSPNVIFRPDEKGSGGASGGYLISRTSVGPTPLSEKLIAVVGAKYRSLRGRVGGYVRSGSPTPSVNLDRGTSQFGPPPGVAGAHSRGGSGVGGAGAGGVGGPADTKGKFVDWWGRLAEDGNDNWRLRSESQGAPIVGAAGAPTGGSVARSIPNPSLGSNPDFLALLGMDEKQLEREAAARGRGVSGGTGYQRRSISVGGEQHFLGGLGLDFDSADPFSDANAIRTNPAKGTPRMVSAANNPFSDSNAIVAPLRLGPGAGGVATYVQNVRRSRGHSVSAGGGPGGVARQPSNAGYRGDSLYRESNMSVDSSGTRRNKFRSDPFDLDRPDLLQNAGPGGAGRVSRSSKNIGLPNTPRQAHIRNESFSSKYSSGVSSLLGWSEPGPDVGPAAVRYTPSPDSRLERSSSERSGKSVGKAL